MREIEFQICYSFFIKIAKTEKGVYPIKIIDEHDNTVCFSDDIYFFLELLSSFVSNQLNINKTYKLSYRHIDGGYEARVVRKNKIHYLKIDIEKNSYYLEKYDCKIIYSSAKSILSKCTYKEFLE